MAKWQNENATGISIGGEWYPADSNGVVDVPDGVIGLSEHGFVPFVPVETSRKKSQEEVKRDA